MRSATAASLALLAAVAVGIASPAPAAAESAATYLGRAQRAFSAGDYPTALAEVRKVRLDRIINDDYALWIRGQSEGLTGHPAAALATFRRLAKLHGSSFASEVPWRIADCMWTLGRQQQARVAYQRLLAHDSGRADEAVARFRVAVANRARGKRALARRELEALRLEHPQHPLIPEALRLLRADGGDDAVAMSPHQRLERARHLHAAHDWHEAVAELRRIGDDVPPDLGRDRDYELGMTLFDMRRRYGDAGRILLGLYKEMGKDAARALFHGARALSRADHDLEAIRYYKKLVADYRHSRWAPEAQFLAGWLQFNMGHYEASIPDLDRTRKAFHASRWAVDALWFGGMARYLIGRYDDALPLFGELAKKGGRLVGGKGAYWHARTLQKLGRDDEALAEYRALVGRFPFAWYALLARARIKQAGGTIGPFGDDPRDTDVGTDIAQKVDESLAKDLLIRTADELIAADLGVEAGNELRRGERDFLHRHKKRRADALAILLDRYRRAGNFNRPWYLAEVYGRKALSAPPKGQAKVWWKHGYPRAYSDLIDKWRDLGGNPPYYLYSIMRKESGFDPHCLSYADAYGLLQMIPPTTKKVVRELGIPYTDDLLFDPELNVRTGSWYIGHLLHKFAMQIPIGSGSFNSGPRPWMRWIDENGDRPMDEFIELVSYRQTREYAKKVTETYARYQYLYDGVVYDQPLTIDKQYVVDDLIY